MASTEANPYKQVWNSLRQEESELLERTKNNVLFIPTHRELGQRYVGRSRHLLKKARYLGRTAAGIETFNEAVFYRNMASFEFKTHGKILKMSR